MIKFKDYIEPSYAPLIQNGSAQNASVKSPLEPELIFALFGLWKLLLELHLLAIEPPKWVWNTRIGVTMIIMKEEYSLISLLSHILKVMKMFNQIPETPENPQMLFRRIFPNFFTFYSYSYKYFNTLKFISELSERPIISLPIGLDAYLNTYMPDYYQDISKLSIFFHYTNEIMGIKVPISAKDKMTSDTDKANEEKKTTQSKSLVFVSRQNAATEQLKKFSTNNSKKEDSSLDFLYENGNIFPTEMLKKNVSNIKTSAYMKPADNTIKPKVQIPKELPPERPLKSENDLIKSIDMLGLDDETTNTKLNSSPHKMGFGTFDNASKVQYSSNNTQLLNQSNVRPQFKAEEIPPTSYSCYIPENNESPILKQNMVNFSPQKIQQYTPQVAPPLMPQLRPQVQPQVTVQSMPPLAPQIRLTVPPATMPQLAPQIRPTVPSQAMPQLAPQIRPIVRPTTMPQLAPQIRPIMPSQTIPQMRPNLTSNTIAQPNSQIRSQLPQELTQTSGKMELQIAAPTMVQFPPQIRPNNTPQVRPQYGQMIQQNPMDQSNKPLANVINEEINKFRSSFFIDISEIKITERIGSGASADVYKAFYRGTEIAVKVLRNLNENDTEKINELRRELNALLILRHPNLVLFMGTTISSNGSIGLVSEFCSGGNLFNLLHESPVVLNWKQRGKIALDIAKGMNSLHSYKPPILHRDLKSLNLLLVEPVTSQYDPILVKITDLGLARFQSNDQYMTGMAGTFHWMAPEVLGGMPYTIKADVYSYAIVLWEIITRKKPYEGMDPRKIMNLVLNLKQRPDQTCIPSDCPPLVFFVLISSCGIL